MSTMSWSQRHNSSSVRMPSFRFDQQGGRQDVTQGDLRVCSQVPLRFCLRLVHRRLRIRQRQRVRCAYAYATSTLRLGYVYASASLFASASASASGSAAAATGAGSGSVSTFVTSAVISLTLASRPGICFIMS